MPDKNPEENQESQDHIPLNDGVAEEIERRVEKRQSLVEDAQDIGQKFREAQQKAENQMESNQTFLEAVAIQNEVDPDEYIYDAEKRALRPLTDKEKARRKAQREQMQAPKEGPVEENPLRKTTDMDTNEAVLYIRENGLDGIAVPEDEDRVLVQEAVKKAKA